MPASPQSTPEGLRPEPPMPEHHHRDVRGGAARAAVFGASDGLVSNVGLILGVAGADPAPGVVRIAGLAGLVAGAISMAAGEYNSMRVQAELFEREVALERIEIRRNPHVETAELDQLYQSRGVEPEAARALAASVMADEDLAVQTHAREELGIDPDELGSPAAAAVSSFFAFVVGAIVPLIPWLFGSGTAAIVGSLVAALVAAVVIGVAVARFTDRGWVRPVIRQVLLTALPAALTFAIGSAVGVSV
ncbi:MAG: VIT1/CCC1 transporter family protein [Acidimicrobiales bacterium]